MQWLIDIMCQRILAENPNLASLNAIDPVDSVFAHGAGDAWQPVTGASARDAIGLGVADNVEFAHLIIDQLTLDGETIDSDTGTIRFGANHLANVRTISALEMYAPTIHCNTLDVDDIDFAGDIEANNYTSQIHLGFSGSAYDFEIRREAAANLILRKLAAVRMQLGFSEEGAYAIWYDNNTALQAMITGYSSANVQAFFKLGRVGIGTSTPAKMLDVAGDITLESGSGDYYSNDGSQGWSGTFLDQTTQTVTVKNGIITSVT